MRASSVAGRGLRTAITALLSMNTRLDEAKAARDALEQAVHDQRERNAALISDIENCDDPERIAAIAREKLGLVGQDEIVFIDTSK